MPLGTKMKRVKDSRFLKTHSHASPKPPSFGLLPREKETWKAVYQLILQCGSQSSSGAWHLVRNTASLAHLGPSKAQRDTGTHIYIHVNTRTHTHAHTIDIHMHIYTHSTHRTHIHTCIYIHSQTLMHTHVQTHNFYMLYPQSSRGWRSGVPLNAQSPKSDSDAYSNLRRQLE